MKSVKRIVAVLMTVLLLLGTVSVAMTSTAASKKVTKVALNKTSVTVYLGNTYTLKATVSPSNATNKKVNWSTSNSSVATVSSSGKLTPKKTGTATITCKAADGSGKKATCKVTVKKAVKVTGIKLNATSKSINVGSTYTLKATVSPSSATNKKVKWSSSDTKIATVSSSGKVTAKKAGTATITCKAADGSGKKATCKITVKKIAVAKVKLDKSEVTLPTNGTVTLKAAVSPSNATDKSIKWTSSNTKVATVSSKGVVTALKTGKATIVASSKSDSKKKAVCEVTVSGIGVASIKLNATSYTSAPGKTVTLKATISPSNAKNKTLKWTSSNTSVATVDSNGKVTLKKDGTATITAKSTDGTNKSATCKITVETVKVTGVKLSATSVSCLTGATYQLNATVSPSNASIKTVKWTSSDTKVATVDSTGKVRALKEGTATITVTTTDGNKKATCKVKVAPKVSAITIYTNVATWYKGKTGKLTAIVTPTGANQDVTWLSSNTNYAKVDSKGNVTIVDGPGFLTKSVTITATAKDGSGVKGTYEIELKDKVNVTGIAFDAKNATTCYVGQIYEPIINYTPADASEKTCTYKSSNENVVKIQSDGSILMVGTGIATITATSVDNNKCVDTIQVTVEAPSLKFSFTETAAVKGGTVELTVVAKPATLLNDLDLEIVADSTVLNLVSHTRRPYSYATYHTYKFYAKNSGAVEVKAVAKRKNDVVISTEKSAKVTISELVVDNYYEGVNVGDKIEIKPEVIIGKNKVESPNIAYMISDGNKQYFKEGWQMNSDGSVAFEIAEELPEDGASVQLVYTYKNREKVVEDIYFTKDTFIATPASMEQFKALAGTISGTGAKREKEVDYINTKVSSSELDISASNGLLNLFLVTNKDLLLGELDVSASDVVYEMFTESLYETESNVKPKAIDCNEDMVKKVSVSKNPGSVTYEMVLELKNQGSLDIDNVANSAYGKTMPVIDKAYADKFAESMKKTIGDNKENKVTYGKFNQTYKDGKIVLTINKITGKIEKVEYSFKSDMDFKNAEMLMAEELDSIGNIYIDLKADFTMTVEEKLTYYMP